MISIVNGLESTDHANQTLKQAAEKLGWKVTICDGQGNPQKWITCGQTLLSQGVDAIVEDAIDPTQLKPVLDAAKKKNVPVIEFTGQVSPGMLAYYPDEAKSGDPVGLSGQEARHGQSGRPDDERRLVAHAHEQVGMVVVDDDEREMPLELRSRVLLNGGDQIAVVVAARSGAPRPRHRSRT